MKARLKSGALCTAFALISPAAPAIDILHVGNADSADYSAFIEAEYPGSLWVHNPSGTGVNQVGGDLDRITDFTVNGTHGGGQITVRAYLESFDLVIIGNGVTSGNFADGANGADWAAITRPVLFHPSLAARTIAGRPGMFSGDNNVSFTYGNPDDSLRVSTTPLGNAIFNGVAAGTDLYSGTFTETISNIASFGGGELISSLTDGTTNHHGIVFWNAGVTNGAGLTLAGKRAFLPLRNAANTSNTLTTDGKVVLGNLIGELLVASDPVFLPPSGVVAKSGVGEIKLSWTASAGATSYNIKRSETAGSGHVTVSTAGAVTGTTYTDTGLSNGTAYYYVVTAVDDSPVAESAPSTEASAVPVPVLQPGIDILYVANADSAPYQNFASNGQFANNTWTQKATGFGNDQIGGDLDRIATFTGNNSGTDIPLRDYLERFELIIISGPTTSGNFADGSNGADWAELTTPVIIHSAVVARGLGGRPGLFAGDNFTTFTHGVPDDTIRASATPLGNALFAGVAAESDLYGFLQSDVINGIATLGNGEVVTRLTDGVAAHYGLVFWATGDILGSGHPTAGNRAFLPLKGGIDDLNANGKQVLTNLIGRIQLPQVTPDNPYGAWAAVQISALDTLLPAGFEADADNDGLGNGLEWTLGGNPLESDPGDLRPAFTANPTGGLSLVFRRETASIAGTTLAVEWSTDLASFPNRIPIGTADVPPNGSEPSVDLDAPAAGQVTVRIPAANAAGGRIFARLKAEPKP